MFVGASKNVGGGIRIGSYFRLGRSRRVPVYTKAFCESFRDDLYGDMKARGVQAPDIDRHHDSLARRSARWVFGSALVPFRG